MPTARTNASTARLTIEDWVSAALEIMTDEGIAGVKVNRLCDRLGVTKGSFYWHFADLDALLSAIADRYGTGRDEARQQLRELATAEPRVRLTRAMLSFFDLKMGPLDAAMRAWGQTDERAREACAKSDEYIFGYANRAFRDLGFDAAEADMRAKTLYYAGVGLTVVGPLGRRGTARQIDEVLDMLTRR